MNISIINDKEINDVNVASKLIWKKYQNGFFIYLTLLLICSLILIFLGINSEYDHQTITNQSGEFQINQYNYNLMIAIGVCVLFFQFLMMITFFKQKSRFEKQKIFKLERTDNYTERILNNEYFEFKSNNVSRKSRWEIFETYKVIGEYMFLNLYKKSNVYAEFLNLTKLNSEQKNELFDVLRKKNILNE